MSSNSLPILWHVLIRAYRRENRRVVNDPSRQASIEEFHTVLSDVSYGECTDMVKKFIVQSYVRGARYGSAELCPLEKVTSVFTKRRYRDAWNRALVRKIATLAGPLTVVRLLVDLSGTTPPESVRCTNVI